MKVTEHQKSVLRALAAAGDRELDTHEVRLAVDPGTGRGPAFSYDAAHAALVRLEKRGLAARRRQPALGVVGALDPARSMWRITDAGRDALGLEPA